MEEANIAIPVDYAKLMAESAAKAISEEKVTSDFISFRSGILSIAEQPVPGNSIRCVILASAYENAYFPDKFDPNVPRSPDCWALGHEEDLMAPDQALVTKAVCSSCDICPQNQWPDEKGKAKGCKNIRRLALIDAASLGSDPSQVNVWYARLPVTSVSNWSKYVVQIGSVVKRPSWGIITELKVVPDIKSQFKVTFQFVGLVKDENLELTHALYETEYSKMLFPYPKNLVAGLPAGDKAEPAKGKKF